MTRCPLTRVVPRGLPAVRPDAVHVLLRRVVEGSDPPSEISAVLSDDEHARATRFVRDGDRRRFIEAHACLRLALGHYLGADPSELTFCQSAHGKPELVDSMSRPPVHFNLTHTAGLIAVAFIGGDRRVGIDVERRRPLGQIHGISSRFRRREAALIAATPSEARADLFLRLWSRKEAMHKADGRGLALPLDTFDALEESCDAWRVSDLALSPEHVGAVAYEAAAQPLPVETHWWPN